MNLLILSPHRGTAAISLAVAIPRWLTEGHRVTIMTIFSRSLTAPFSDAETVHANDRLTYVSAMRRKEDEHFERLHPKLTLLDLNLKDAAIRHRIAEEEAFQIPASPADTAIEKIQKAIAKLAGASAHPVQAMLLPLGLGDHLDHRVVRDAALAAEASQALPIAFYEDQPYASQLAAFADRVTLPAISGFEASALTPFFVALNIATDPANTEQTNSAAKLRDKTLALYASQIDEQHGSAIRLYAAANQQCDRLWTPADWPIR